MRNEPKPLGELAKGLKERGLEKGATVKLTVFNKDNPHTATHTYDKAQLLVDPSTGNLLEVQMTDGSRMRANEKVIEGRFAADSSPQVLLETSTKFFRLVLVERAPQFPQGMLTKQDLERELRVFGGKTYGDFDLQLGKVKPEDAPGNILMGQHGFEVGNKVELTVLDGGTARIVNGVLEQNGSSWEVRDSKGAPWSVTGALRYGGRLEKK